MAINESDALSKYTVKWLGDENYELIPVEGGGKPVEVSPQVVSLHIDSMPEQIRWSVGSLSHVLELKISNLEVGHRGDEGWSSDLEENGIFVIEEEGIRSIRPTLIRVMSLPQYNADMVRLSELRGEVTPESEKADDEDPSTSYRGRISHGQFGPRGREEFIEWNIGLPQESFDVFVDECSKFNGASVHIFGQVRALSASFRWGSARDLILISEREVEFFVSSIHVKRSLLPERSINEEALAVKPESPDYSEVAAYILEEVRAFRASTFRAILVLSAAIALIAILSHS